LLLPPRWQDASTEYFFKRRMNNSGAVVAWGHDAHGKQIACGT